jgi:hypothetical protein
MRRLTLITTCLAGWLSLAGCNRGPQQDMGAESMHGTL